MWPMARVVELHPGSDGHVRVVTLKTEKGYLKRPIVKLSILPIQKASGDSDSSEQMQENKTKNKRSIGHSSLHSIVMALLFFTTLVSSVNGTSNITHLNEKQTLYFNPLAKLQLMRDQWTLVTYYEMEPFWDGTEAFKKLLDYLEKSCIIMDTNNKCNQIIPQLRHEYTELQYYNQLLLTQHFTEHSRRRRRGLINGVSYMANALFGVLDERFAEQYKRDINLIKQDQAHLKRLWFNQTSVVESEYNYLKRLEGIMDKQHKAINRQLNNYDEAIRTLQREVIKVDKEEDFTMSAIMATNMIHKLKEIQAMMVETITDIYQGQFNLHLLTPQQLQEQLNIIAGLLTKDLTLPVENIHTDYRKLYKLMKIRARMTKDYFIFEIKIPLISRESFNLYNVISIPKKVGNYVLKISPVADIIAINLQKDSYLPITQENLKECVSCDAKTFMCKLQTPVFKMKSDKDLCILDNTNNECKTSKTACENKWTGLTTVNNYLYFCCEQCQLRIICGDRVTAHHLIGSNVIYQDYECVIKTNDFTIYGHRNFESKINLNYDIQMPNIAPINQIINISLDHYLDDNDTVAELTVFKKDIEQKIKSLKQSNVNDGQSVSIHDIHHYALIYCIVGVILLVGVVAAWHKVRRNWNNPNVDSTTEEQRGSRPHPAPRTSISTSQQDIQMVDIDISGKRDVKSRVAFPKLVFSDESL